LCFLFFKTRDRVADASRWVPNFFQLATTGTTVDFGVELVPFLPKLCTKLLDTACLVLDFANRLFELGLYLGERCRLRRIQRLELLL
jgi:hypothetical protein